ncbi:MAG: NusG domain II-containing protein [Clostridia bacterium]|nr:NusG domain II-containing protein [Clostridia bacterium]
MLKKGDIVLIISVIIIIIVAFWGMNFLKGQSAGTKKIAVIKQGDKVIRRIDLETVQKAEHIKVPGDYPDTILVEKGRIRFLEAECPDQVCIKIGWLKEQGDSAVCLPNRTMIRIEGEGGKVDGVAF